MGKVSAEDFAERLIKALVDEGKLVEAGWASYRLAVLPANVPQVQLDEMRTTFFAGAQHLFASIMTMLDPGQDPSDADLSRMDLIHKELGAFAEQLAKSLSKGSG